MATVSTFLSVLNAWAPPVLAWEKDNIGLLVGSPSSPVERVLVTLDVTPEVVKEAIDGGAQLIVSHHPFIFHPLRSIRTDEEKGKMVETLLRNGIAVISMHTNADASEFGLNNALGEALGLRHIEPLQPPRGLRKKRSIGVQKGSEAEEQLRELLATIGIRSLEWDDVINHGTMFEFEVLTWQEAGINAVALGIESDDVYLSQTTTLDDTTVNIGMGGIGDLSEALGVDDFLRMVSKSLSCEGLRYSYPPAGTTIRRVAWCGGSGMSLLREAISQGADAYVTSDVTYHDFQDAAVALLLVDAGHYETEKVFISRCAQILRESQLETTEKIDILLSRIDTNPVRFFRHSLKETS